MAGSLAIAAVAAGLLLIYHYIIYPVWISSLAKIPNAHFTACISPLWIMYKRHQFAENKAIFAAHEKFGSVVRLGPNEIHVNCVDDGLRTIYVGGYEKHTWYHLFANYDNVHTMFSTVRGRPHSHRKRMMSNIYAKSTIQSSQGYANSCQTIVHARLLPFMYSHLSPGRQYSGAVDLWRLFNFATMDLVTAYMFGIKAGANFLEQNQIGDWWLALYQSRKKYTFWPQEYPHLTSFLAKFGLRLSPQWVADANSELEKWCMQICDHAGDCVTSMTDQDAADRPEDIPNVYRQLRKSIQAEDSQREGHADKQHVPPLKEESRLVIASECLDQLSAGHETSSITLSYLFHELCQHPEIQDILRRELFSFPDLRRPYSKDAQGDQVHRLPSAKALDGLPYLHAVLMETLRLHPAIPGPEPRITPSVGPQKGSSGLAASNSPAAAGVTLGPYSSIPANVRVSSSPYSLHRNPSVFPSPMAFQPGRWLPAETPEEEAKQKEQHRWFWAFSSGGRMCIGSNLAMAQMKLLIAIMVTNFRFVEVLDEGEGEGMEQEDAYTAQPSGMKLVVRFELV